MSPADPIARPRRGGAYSVPNLLTYGRVLAVPLVAACLFVQVIYEGGILSLIHISEPTRPY